MMEWIAANKQWLFSGVGVSACFVLFYSLRFFYGKRKTSTVLVAPQYPVVSPSNEAKVVSLSNQAPEAAKSILMNTSSVRPISQITPYKIYEELRKLPPLQLEAAFGHYVGLRIDWNTILSSASKDRNHPSHVRLQLAYEQFWQCSIFCVVDGEKYKDLVITKQDSPIRVIGEIKSVDLYSIHLINCELEILPEPTRKRPEGKKPVAKGKRRRKSKR